MCRHAGRSLSATIVKTDPANPLDYAQIIGIGDGSVFGNSLATWQQPSVTEDLCYIGTLPPLLVIIRGQAPRERSKCAECA